MAGGLGLLPYGVSHGNDCQSFPDKYLCRKILPGTLSKIDISFS